MQFQNKVSADLSSKILTVGPEYRNHRGGIGAVIESYSRNFEIFNFISTYRDGSVIARAFIFLRGVAKLFFLLVRNRKIKILHIHGASSGSFYRKYIVFIISKYIFRKWVIYHIHGGGFQEFYKSSNRLGKRMVRTLLHKADLVICISNSWLEYFKRDHGIKRIMVIPNIIDTPDKKINIKQGGRITFLFLGLVTEAKGIFDLVDVIAKNKEKYMGKIKLLVGGNGKTEKLKILIEKYEIEDIVEFLGWVKGSEKAEILNKTDVYILPSYIEGSPISILEAMSYGKPIIASNVGGIPELIKNLKNGILIEPGNFEQIENAIDWFIVNPGLIKTYGLLSEQMSREHLPENIIKRLVSVYQGILSSVV
ncbi:MAG: glycosyltransferase family 4 protein [Bacteroidetes bacterium]|nr:glycosyltransferase family 4 protein [Bacteroidota bacterium]